jgi:hypothetical protein
MGGDGEGTCTEVARIVRRCLDEGSTVEIDGLGTFRLGRGGEYEFIPQDQPRIFLAYADEDFPQVRKLYAALEGQGLDPWLDKERLLPGQNWPRAIERAIERSDFFVACFSGRSTSRRGYFHSELRYALDCAGRLPLEEVFLIPVRLEECEVPPLIRGSIQYVDLFPDWVKGVARIVATVRRARRASGRPRSGLSG